MKRNKLPGIILLACCALFAGMQANAKGIEVRNGNIILDFSTKIASQTSAGTYTIKRSTGRFSEYQTIGSTSSTTFIDKKVKGNPHDYYYQITDKKGNLLASMAMDTEVFGDYVYIYSDTDRKVDVGNEINAIHEQMFGKEFSPNRYALLFKAGDYKEAGLLKVPFYVHLAGLGKTPFDVEVSISTFTSGRTFLDSYTEKGQYQLIFMDVEMPELNGLDTASILRSTIDRYALLVFVSNYPEYMQKSFTVRAFYYLTKPYTTEDVEEVLKNAINEIEQSHTIYSIVSTTEGETTIYIQDLLYIEVENSDTQTLLFHLTNHTISVHGTLSYWKETLASQHFYKCYRSILLNLKHVHYFEDKFVVLDNQERIPLSRNARRELLSIYMNHLVELNELN